MTGPGGTVFVMVPAGKNAAALPQAEAQLRLINGYYGGGEPRIGQSVKVVE